MRSPWWVVCTRELRDLWIGGKGPFLILLYTLLLGGYSFTLASSVEVKMMLVSEMILEMVKASISVGLLITMVIAADSISGERERRTLEGLLLSPASRRQIVFGKLLAAASVWPVALAISVPYWVVAAKGDPVLGPVVSSPRLRDFALPDDAVIKVLDRFGHPLAGTDPEAQLGPPVSGTHDVGDLINAAGERKRHARCPSRQGVEDGSSGGR